MTLQQMISLYERNDAPSLKSHLKFYSQFSDIELISIAAKCVLPDGKRHAHQRRLKQSALNEAEELLLGANSRINSASSFENLHALIECIIKPVNGIGPLTIYDISLRIGSSNNLTPKYVYLHSGALEGARALGLKGTRLEKSAFPREIARLGAEHIENFLCVYKMDLAGNKCSKLDSCDSLNTSKCLPTTSSLKICS